MLFSKYICLLLVGIVSLIAVCSALPTGTHRHGDNHRGNTHGKTDVISKKLYGDLGRQITDKGELQGVMKTIRDMENQAEEQQQKAVESKKKQGGQNNKNAQGKPVNNYGGQEQD